MSQVIVYGGCGALGSALVKLFKAKSWRVISIDIKANSDADENIALDRSLSLEDQGQQAMIQLADLLSSAHTQPTVPAVKTKVDAIVCVAGGWAGGNAAASNLFESTLAMWNQSVQPSVIAAHIATKYLRDGGMLSLAGALVAQQETPTMIGYGMAKASVHQLTVSLADPSSGMPKDSNVNCLLPVVLDTPANRQGMPGADFSSWTSLGVVAQ
ncbi:hypothetical protein H4R34_005117 [Dimargaris verticillata]|uniref:Dihydropteridine reductase n=1 Tax=Dimargaris verticillata TaxID=2761393 RepID=A0A9W8AXL7_9FUNG|nr:hypothetical protein H4R34_005117 [Dimargaris verticillata]